jgi:xylan 1,4-beta-xylosidase
VSDNTFRCDLAATTSPLPHVWEHTIGSGHATLALRADYQQQLARCRRELGFRHVRFHGILSDDVGTLMCEEDAPVYSFFNADQIFDFLRSIGMRPFVELSFMPTTLASGGDEVFHYHGNITPPKSYTAWATLIDKLVRHWIDRYGIAEVRTWFFEVWNEPNLKAFWTGSQADYFQLYEHTARAIKAIDTGLSVGGPATADNAWIPELMAFCKHRDVPIDFVSTHHYPTDAFGKPGDDTIAQLAASERSVLREEAAKSVAQAHGKPVYYTEWSTSSNPFDDLHDEAYAAAFVIKTVLEVRELVSGYSYWTFSDIFEENYFTSKPFHGGFGLLTIDGIAKPAYRAYELLHRLGDQSLPVEGAHPTVDVWVSRQATTVTIMITNGALPRHPITTELVHLVLGNVPSIAKATLERIDGDHANPRRAWHAMGEPMRPRADQIAALDLASQLVVEPAPHGLDGTTATFDLVLPPQATVLVTVVLA